MSQHSVLSITQFILNNRKDSKAFYNWTAEEIMLHISQCYHKKTLGVVTDESTGELAGVATGDVNIVTKTFHVSNVLTIRDCGITLKLLLKLFKSKYPFLKLTARRHDKLRQYADTDKLLTRAGVKFSS